MSVDGIEGAEDVVRERDSLADAEKLVGYASEVMRRAVALERNRGVTWDEIGARLGVSRQAAHSRYAGALEWPSEQSAESMQGLLWAAWREVHTIADEYLQRPEPTSPPDDARAWVVEDEPYSGDRPYLVYCAECDTAHECLSVLEGNGRCTSCGVPVPLPDMYAKVVRRATTTKPATASSKTCRSCKRPHNPSVRDDPGSSLCPNCVTRRRLTEFLGQLLVPSSETSAAAVDDEKAAEPATRAHLLQVIQILTAAHASSDETAAQLIAMKHRLEVVEATLREAQRT